MFARYSCLLLLVCSFVAPGVADQIKADVERAIPAIKQPSVMSCWAAACAMMLSWKQNKTVTIDEAVKLAGPGFVQKFNDDTGLAASDKPALLQALTLKSEPPQSYTAHGWESLVQRFGPLWVTTQEFGVHARIVTGVFGDGSDEGTFLRVIDPADGHKTSENLKTFVTKFEAIAKLDSHSAQLELRPQVVHF